MPCLVHCKIAFSLPKKYRAWHSGVSLRGLYNCDCEQYWPNGWGIPVKTVYISFIPTHFISFPVPINTSYLEIRNIKLVNNTSYNEIKCKVSEKQ